MNSLRSTPHAGSCQSGQRTFPQVTLPFRSGVERSTSVTVPLRGKSVNPPVSCPLARATSCDVSAGRHGYSRVGGGGQGRGRTADLPIFSRTHRCRSATVSTSSCNESCNQPPLDLPVPMTLPRCAAMPRVARCPFRTSPRSRGHGGVAASARGVLTSPVACLQVTSAQDVTSAQFRCVNGGDGGTVGGRRRACNLGRLSRPCGLDWLPSCADLGALPSGVGSRM